MKAARTALYTVAALIIVLYFAWDFAQGFRAGFNSAYPPAASSSR